MRSALVVSALTALALGLASPAVGQTVKDSFGKTLGKSTWRAIEVTESRLSIEGDLSDFRQWRANSLPDRWQELALLQEGRLFSEFLTHEYFSASEYSESSLIQFIDREWELSKKGYQIINGESRTNRVSAR